MYPSASIIDVFSKFFNLYTSLPINISFIFSSSKRSEPTNGGFPNPSYIYPFLIRTYDILFLLSFIQIIINCKSGYI